MVFSSVIFLIYFLPLFLAVYYAFRGSNIVLLGGSLLFYAWGEGRYLLLLGALVLINVWLGIRIEENCGRRRRLLLGAAVAINLLPLITFKYWAFVLGNLSPLFAIPPGWIHKFALPLGISFFTFQNISYLVDVSREKIRAERRPVLFACYIMMFPHLIAGPIVRYAEIAEGLRRKAINQEVISLGVQYFVVGLCQKTLIANVVAPVADAAFDMPVAQLSTWKAWFGSVSYMMQIYFDFCGYSNMAIGLAFLLGLKFPRNFFYPYAAVSITDFWRRWHISLSLWFRDYVYIPLGGNRRGLYLTVANLLIVFFLTGLWHGAAWHFIVWGMFHGACLFLERVGGARYLQNAPLLLQRTYTLLVVLVGWVFFRAADLDQAGGYLHAMFLGGNMAEQAMPLIMQLTPEFIVALALGIVLSVPAFPGLLTALATPTFFGSIRRGAERDDTMATHLVPTSLLLLGLTASLAMLVTGSLNPFLYFRF